jgi:hypothetical protein
MPASPRRKRFQIHLSTAIVLMFAAGGLLWANIAGTESIVQADRWDRPADVYYHLRTCGWPLQATYIVKYTYGPNAGIFSGGRYSDAIPPTTVFVNGAVGLTILFSVWFLCERLIHRAAGKEVNP